ncbi:MAG: sulfotransferase [Phycisphaerae bacterium]
MIQMIRVDEAQKNRSPIQGPIWKLICVTGMMRTGSSALTRGLASLGIELGSQVQKSEQGVNPTGFWEDTRTYDALHRVYRAIGLGDHMSAGAGNIPHDRWDRPKVRVIARRLADYLNEFHGQFPRRMCAIKNPSIGRLIPFWQQVMEQTQCSDRYIVTVRSPAAVAASCRCAWNFSHELSYALWVQFTLGAMIPAAKGRPTLAVDYDAFMLDPAGSLRRIARWAEVPFTPEVQDAVNIFTGRFIRRELQHFVGSGGMSAPPLTMQMYELLRRAAEKGEALESAPFQSRWQRVESLSSEYTRDLHRLDAARRKPLAKRIYWRGHSAVKDSITRLQARAAGRLQ